MSSRAKADRRPSDHFLGQRLTYWSSLILAACAIASFALLIKQGRSLISALYLNADTASAPVIASLMGSEGSHGVVTLGNYPWYESMWWMLATKWLPDHRDIWLLSPFVFTAVAAGCLAWTSWKTMGARVALLVVAPLTCVSYGMREILFTPDWHGAVVIHTCVLDVVLVAIYRHWSTMTRLQRIAVGVLVTMLTAAGETDLLLLAVGVIPFICTALILWWRARHGEQRELAMFAMAIGVAATLGGEAAAYGMRRADVSPSPFHIGISLTGIPAKAGLLARAIAYLGGGYSVGGSITTSMMLSAAVVFALAAIAVILGVNAMRRPVTVLRPDHPTAWDEARDAHILFWSLVLIGSGCVFLFTTAPSGVLSARYVATAFVAIFAILPVAGHHDGWRRTGITVAIATYAALATYQVATAEIAGYGTGPVQSVAYAVQRYVRSQGATQGYAEYRDAAVITWLTHLHTRVYPVMTCDTPVGLCPFYLHVISSWYGTGSRRRSFLITDSGATETEVATPPPGLGEPISSTAFGDLTVYIYAGDIANRL